MTDPIISFDCPSCGAPLDAAHAVNNLARCPYCAKSVIVPESLRSQPEPPRQQVIQVNVSHPYEAPPIHLEQLPPARNAARGISCLIPLILLVSVGAALFAFAAPPLAVSAILSQLKGVIPGLGEDGFTLPGEAKGLEILSTVSAVQTQAYAMIEPTPGQSFYQVQLEFGAQGIGPGMFNDSRWVTVDPAGNLYIAGYLDGRVQKFTPDGAFTSLIQVKDDVALYDLVVNRQGVLYLAQQGKILKFDAASGASLGQVESAPGHYYDALALTPDGGLLAVTDDDTIIRFDAAEQVTLTIPDAIQSVTGETPMDTHAFVDGLGNIYLLEFKSGSVFVYSREGKYQNRMFSAGPDETQLHAPADLVVDGKGRIFISDFKGVMVFSADGQYQGLIEVQGAPFGLAVDDQNRVYILSNAPRLYRVALQ